MISLVVWIAAFTLESLYYVCFYLNIYIVLDSLKIICGIQCLLSACSLYYFVTYI